MLHEHAAALSAASHLVSTKTPERSHVAKDRVDSHREELGRPLLFSRPSTTHSDSLTLRILVANDVRMDIKNILKIAQQLGETHISRGRPVQAILLPGDLAAAPAPAPATAAATAAATTATSTSSTSTAQSAIAQVANAEGEVMAVLKRFEQIKRRIFYIPGITDPISLFARSVQHSDTEKTTSSKTPPHLTLRSVNIHDWWVEIAEGVIIAGYGGNGTGDDSTVVDGCRRVMERAIEWWKQQNKDDQGHGNGHGSGNDSGNGATEPQIIFMTHAAPLNTSTSSNSGVGSIGGIDGIGQLLSTPEAQKAILLHVHGQGGGNIGQDSIGDVPVLNAGSLNVGGEYAIVDFVRTGVTEKWSLDSVLWRQVRNQVTR